MSGSSRRRTKTDTSAVDVREVPLSRTSWMKENMEYLAPLALTQICLPGAHNAGTYAVKSWCGYGCDAPGLLRKQSIVGKVARTFAKGTTADWARCQSMSVYNQLKHGVRYFDFRLAPNYKANGDLYISHSMFSDSLAAVAEDVYFFSKSECASDEFIVLDFQSIFLEKDEEMEAKFYTPLRSIADRCVPNSVPLSTPLRELLARSATERIFVLVDRKFPLADHPKAFPRKSFLQSKWKNKQSTTELIKAFDEELRTPVKKSDPVVPTRFHVVQAVLTPATTEIVRGLLIHYKPTLRHLALDANARLLQWFHDRNATNTAVAAPASVPPNDGRYKNILMIDFVEEGTVTVHRDPHDDACVQVDAVDLCIYLNRLRSPDRGL